MPLCGRPTDKLDETREQNHRLQQFDLNQNCTDRGPMFDRTFDDGILAGVALREVLKRNSSDPACIPKLCSADELQPVLDYIADVNGSRMPYVEGFCSAFVTRESTRHRDSIIDVWGADVFVANQSEFAPISNLDGRVNKLIQFADWCGEDSDGDGWCMDLQDGLVRCIPVGADEESGMNHVKACSYGCFHGFEHLAPYLELVAKHRSQ
jgi:hypothetical protein